MNEETELLTVRQVSQYLGMKEITIRTWIAQRRLGSVKLGRSVRIRRDEVDLVVDEGTRPARRKDRLN